MIHVLVVDDETDISDLFQQRFRKEIRSGLLSLSFANSGAEALDYFNIHAKDIQLILSDINMPGMDGLEMLRILRQQTPGDKPIVIMITAYGDEKNYKTAMDFGANDFLTKPLDFNELKRRVADYVG